MNFHDAVSFFGGAGSSKSLRNWNHEECHSTLDERLFSMRNVNECHEIAVAIDTRIETLRRDIV